MAIVPEPVQAALLHAEHFAYASQCPVDRAADGADIQAQHGGGHLAGELIESHQRIVIVVGKWNLRKGLRGAWHAARTRKRHWDTLHLRRVETPSGARPAHAADSLAADARRRIDIAA